MQQLKLLLFSLLVIFANHVFAQKSFEYDAVNIRSYGLYEKGSWKELISYGNEAIENGQDFTLLRLRIGYAAFMIGNFSEAVKAYEKVLLNDSYNATAHYYLWLCRKYLNQSELADKHLAYLSAETLQKEGQNKIAFTGVGVETSFKSTDINGRGNTWYHMLHVENRFGWNVHMSQAISYFNQSIQLPTTGLPGNAPLTVINQVEYYNKLTFNLSNQWQLKAVYHFTNTPINNTIYNNHSGLIGIKYSSHYFDVQADGIFSKMYDSTISQFDLQLGYYPLGNQKLYGISTAIYRNRNTGSGFNFRQVLGGQIAKKIWLEGNVTLGSFQDLYENDALYLYNAVDKNKFKAGVMGYFSIGKKCIFELGYTTEQRTLYGKTNTFNQNSITGGLKWKF
jgi:tetratricopeptide (TPR) repeat protein